MLQMSSGVLHTRRDTSELEAAAHLQAVERCHRKDLGLERLDNIQSNGVDPFPWHLGLV